MPSGVHARASHIPRAPYKPPDPPPRLTRFRTCNWLSIKLRIPGRRRGIIAPAGRLGGSFSNILQCRDALGSFLLGSSLYVMLAPRFLTRARRRVYYAERARVDGRVFALVNEAASLRAKGGVYVCVRRRWAVSIERLLVWQFDVVVKSCAVKLLFVHSIKWDV